MESTMGNLNDDNRLILRKQTDWNRLFFYQKTDVLYRLTKHFTSLYLQRNDRTVDQMVQAARSGKQNIVEGIADGVGSVKMEMNLLNVARASIQELREDYKDYLATRGLTFWETGHGRQAELLHFCRTHNKVEDYIPLFTKANDEELCNLAITLCRQVDSMLTTWLRKLEQIFKEEGGLSERMTAARLGYRHTQKEIIEAQAHEIEALKRQIAYLEAELKRLSTKK